MRDQKHGKGKEEIIDNGLRIVYDGQFREGFMEGYGNLTWE